MNPLTWLRSLLGRPSAPVSPAVLTPIPLRLPVIQPPPPTDAEREARQQREEQRFLLWLAEDFSRAVEDGADLADAPSTELLRCAWMLSFNTTEQQRARQWGHTAYELQLVTQAQELEATAQHLLWQHALCAQFGHRIGTKLSKHQLEPGMTEDMVLAAYGPPAAGAVTRVPGDPDAYLLLYGNPRTGSVIELRHGLVTRVALGTVAFPAYVYDLLDLTGPDGLLQTPI